MLQNIDVGARPDLNRICSIGSYTCDPSRWLLLAAENRSHFPGSSAVWDGHLAPMSDGDNQPQGQLTPMSDGDDQPQGPVTVAR
ncbi:hypothetical protein K1719_033348 [Acacia pycnantha]|nr:hypothetical protein K1719_033348 [Acacia pycnantha]